MNSIVARHLAAHCGPQDYAYVLLDPTAQRATCPDRLIETLQAALGADALTRVQRPDLSYAQDRCPVLVCLAEPGEAPCPTTLQLLEEAFAADASWRKRTVCGWLISAQPADVIATHLLSLCMLPTAQGGPRFYPIFEPVRLALFWTAFANAPQGPWWPIKHWLVDTHQGEPRFLAGTPDTTFSTPSTASAIQADVPLVLSLLCAWHRLQAVTNHSPAPGEGSPNPTPRQVHAHIVEARALGATQPADLAEAVLRRLMPREQAS